MLEDLIPNHDGGLHRLLETQIGEGEKELREIESQIESLECDKDNLEDELHTLRIDLEKRPAPALPISISKVTQRFVDWICSRCGWVVQDTLMKMIEGEDEQVLDATSLGILEIEMRDFSLVEEGVTA